MNDRPTFLLGQVDPHPRRRARPAEVVGGRAAVVRRVVQLRVLDLQGPVRRDLR